MVTRIVRKPNSLERLDNLPRFIGCEDKPVPKNNKSSLRDVTVNDGTHINGVFPFPLKSRLRKHPIDLIGDNQKYYIPEGGPCWWYLVSRSACYRAMDYRLQENESHVAEEDDMAVMKVLSTGREGEAVAELEAAFCWWPACLAPADRRCPGQGRRRSGPAVLQVRPMQWPPLSFRCKAQ